MANTILLRRSSTASAVPTIGQLQLGEIAINTRDGSLYFKRNNGQDSIVKIWTDANDGAGSGLDADLLDGQHGSYYQNAGSLNSGTLLDARLPTRLGTVAKTITDWNTIQENGYYMGQGAANAPTASIWYIGQVIVHNNLWVTQTVWGFANNSESSDTYTYRRESNNGTWSAWQRIWQTETELDSRYSSSADAIALAIALG